MTVDDYPSHQRCVRTIAGQPGRVVELRFDAFSIEESPGCRADSLSVFDGDARPENEVWTKCGSRLPAELFSSGQTVSLVFKSDGLLTPATGFRARYRLVSKGEP